ncbi:MAG TPA: HEPN domain-containing protein [Sulfuricella sp.]|nr:HEPN domain-containing protein [Sulfuricella sp.]
MQKISWVVLRQLEALRESVAFTLNGGAIDIGTGKPDEYIAAWLTSQGVEPIYRHHVDEDCHVLHMLSTIENAVAEHGVNQHLVRLAGKRSRFSETDVGFERGSTGWDRLPNFITSSALVRLLGALEQFEIDVLKALLYYRPAGKEHVNDAAAYTVVDLAVVTEPPDRNDRYAMPALWSWVKKSAENSVERRKFFKSVFDIECFPSSFGSRKPSEIRKYYQSLYEKRNSLAHGRERIDVTLAEYCKAEAFVLSLVMHLSTACEDRYNLGI